MGQEFESSLARWFWFGTSHEVAVETLLGLQSSERLCLGLEDLLPGWVPHTAVGRRLLSLARHNSSQGCLKVLIMWVDPA